MLSGYVGSESGIAFGISLMASSLVLPVGHCIFKDLMEFLSAVPHCT